MNKVTMPSFHDIMAFSDKWSKEPGFCEFERNDFVSCVYDLLSRYGQSVTNETQAWRERFPDYEYRPQDDCVALKLK